MVIQSIVSDNLLGYQIDRLPDDGISKKMDWLNNRPLDATTVFKEKTDTRQ